MRLLHVADPHLGRTTHSRPGTVSRAEDYGRTLIRFAEVAVEEQVDLAVIPGDLFHTRRPLPRDLYFLGEAIAVCRAGGVPVFISGGNHDGPDTVGDERTHALAWMNGLAPKGVRMFTNASARTVKLATGAALNVVALPYPHKRAFDGVMPEADPEERVEWISRAYENAVDAMIDTVQSEQPDLPTLFLGHVSVVGASLGSEVTMRFGMDVTARSGIFDKTDYAALGHIHRQQQIGDKAWYAGSPEYMDFGEAGQQKGFLLVEVNKGRDPRVEVISSNPRPMLTVEVHESETGWLPSIGSIPEGAIIRLLIHPLVSIPPADVVRLVREYRQAGASFVTHKVVLPEREAVARAYLSAESEAEEALRTWLLAGGHELEPALSTGIELINSMGASGE